MSIFNRSLKPTPTYLPVLNGDAILSSAEQTFRALLINLCQEPLKIPRLNTKNINFMGNWKAGILKPSEGYLHES